MITRKKCVVCKYCNSSWKLVCDTELSSDEVCERFGIENHSLRYRIVWFLSACAYLKNSKKYAPKSQVR